MRLAFLFIPNKAVFDTDVDVDVDGTIGEVKAETGTAAPNNSAVMENLIF